MKQKSNITKKYHCVAHLPDTSFSYEFDIVANSLYKAVVLAEIKKPLGSKITGMEEVNEDRKVH